ncbi:hypothetical protein C7H19_00175 [Aphanothece hegewaldii CCALA 016]|uniref:Uncharacterized protein n=1 Tax=Aphanothece hegewaldii CCALA 016 TaxID=2107694 RepID=A0A2T1M327_9CHRO|nr:hypothetical protein [Aphanothece hegewaldii]PSF39243.1 hypothetical protein C7H19_00175 [Aphanothece hegewaldii CCALA 016]
MKPKFKTLLAWEQAQVLMQPAFIRVIDNIRKELENTTWQGTYQEIQYPYPGYKLFLTKNNQSVIVDIWDLCYQVCFLNYNCTESPEENLDLSQDVEIDTFLLDETENVDWQGLETKAQHVVKKVFASLPAI